MLVGGAVGLVGYWMSKNMDEDAAVVRRMLAELDALAAPALNDLNVSEGSSGGGALADRDPTHAHVDVSETLPDGRVALTRTFDVWVQDSLVHVCVMMPGETSAPALMDRPAVVINAGTVAAARPLALALRRQDPTLVVVSYTHAGLVNQGDAFVRAHSGAQKAAPHTGDAAAAMVDGSALGGPAVTPRRPSSLTGVPISSIDRSSAAMAANALKADTALGSAALPAVAHSDAGWDPVTDKLLAWTGRKEATARWVAAATPGWDAERDCNPLAPHLMASTLSYSLLGDDNALHSSYFTPPLADSSELPTSDGDSDELTAVLTAAAATAGVTSAVLVATHYNWMSTAKTALRNRGRVRGLLLVDPLLPHDSPTLGWAAAAAPHPVLPGQPPPTAGAKTPASTASPASPAPPPGLTFRRVFAGDPRADALWAVPILSQMPVHRWLPPSALVGLSAMPEQELLQLQTEEIGGVAFWLFGAAQGLPLSGAHIMDAVVARSHLVGSGLGPLGAIPAHNIMGPLAAARGEAQWRRIPLPLPGQEAGGAGRMIWPFRVPGAFLTPCIGPLAASPTLHVDALAAGSQADIPTNYVPLTRTSNVGKGMSPRLRPLAADAFGVAAGALGKQHTTAVIARLMAATLPQRLASSMEAAAAGGVAATDGEDADEEDGGGAAAADAAAGGDSPGAADAEGTAAGQNSIIPPHWTPCVDADPSTDETLPPTGLDHTSAARLAYLPAGLPGLQGVARVSFGYGGQDGDEEEEGGQRQKEGGHGHQNGAGGDSGRGDSGPRGAGVAPSSVPAEGRAGHHVHSGAPSDAPDALSFPLTAGADSRYAWLQLHMDTLRAESFMHRLVTELHAAVDPLFAARGGTELRHLNAAERRRLQQRVAEIEASAGAGASGAAAAPPQLLQAAAAQEVANVMVTTLAGLAFPNSRFIETLPSNHPDRRAAAAEAATAPAGAAAKPASGWGGWFGNSAAAPAATKAAPASTSGGSVAAVVVSPQDLVGDTDEIRLLAAKVVRKLSPQQALALAHAGVDMSKLLSLDAATEVAPSYSSAEEEAAGWDAADAARALSRRLLHAPGAWCLPLLRVALAKAVAASMLGKLPLAYADKALDALQQEILGATDAFIAAHAEDEVAEGARAVASMNEMGQPEELMGKRLLAISAVPTFHGRASHFTTSSARGSSRYVIVNSISDAVIALACRQATLEPYRQSIDATGLLLPPQLLTAVAALVDRASPADVSRVPDFQAFLPEADKEPASSLPRLRLKQPAAAATPAPKALDPVLRTAATAHAQAAAVVRAAQAAEAGSGNGASVLPAAVDDPARFAAAAELVRGAAASGTTPTAHTAVRDLGRWVAANLCPELVRTRSPDAKMAVPFPVSVLVTAQTAQSMAAPLTSPPEALAQIKVQGWRAAADAPLADVGQVLHTMQLRPLSKLPTPAMTRMRGQLMMQQAALGLFWMTALGHGTVKLVPPETAADVQQQCKSAFALLPTSKATAITCSGLVVDAAVVPRLNEHAPVRAEGAGAAFGPFDKGDPLAQVGPLAFKYMDWMFARDKSQQAAQFKATCLQGGRLVPPTCFPVVTGGAFTDALTVVSDVLAYGSPQPYRPPLKRLVREVMAMVDGGSGAAAEGPAAAPDA